MQNPLFEEGYRWYFESRDHRINLVILLGVLSALHLLTWTGGRPTDPERVPFQYSYNAMVILTMIIVAFLSLRPGSREAHVPAFQPLGKWCRLSPLPLPRILWGKVGFAAFQTMVWVLLALPFMAAERATSALSGANLGAVLAVLFVCCFAYRAIDLLYASLWDRFEPLLFIVEKLTLLFWLLITLYLVPPLNPILAALDAVRPWPRYGEVAVGFWSLPFYGATLFWHGIMAVAVVGLMYLRLRSLRRAAIG